VRCWVGRASNFQGGNPCLVCSRLERVILNAPFVSVVIPCFQFLSESLNSALRQRGPSLTYEIVVISSQWNADEVARSISTAAGSSASIRLVTSDARNRGGFFGAGLAICTGEVVCFLDHDDIWLPGKLAFVSTAFRFDPGLGYLKHGQQVIDASGNPLPRSTRLRGIATKRTRFCTTVDIDSLARSLAELSGTNAYFNGSSISIRREVLCKYQNWFTQIDKGNDMFFFYAALCSGLRLRVVSEAYTGYRIDNRSPFGGLRKDPERFRAYVHDEAVGHLITLTAIQEMASTTESQVLRNLIRRERAFRILVKNAFSPNYRRWAVGATVLDCIAASSPIGRRQDFERFLWGLATLVSPRLAARLLAVT
jgi:glycosyltransferase involved in cell wall biosynthesis